MIGAARGPVVALGAQRFDPTVRAALDRLEVSGRVATVTAGWQEREDEDTELATHLGGRTLNLRLYHRAEEVFRSDPELRDAHHRRQIVLRHKQDFYRIRLEHELEAAHVIAQRKAPPEVLAEEEEASVLALRELDAFHLSQCVAVRARFDAEWAPWQRPAVARHRRELSDMLRECAALAISGGHVAGLLNRLELFGVADLITDQAVVAWSAGAMAITDRVVLFHDSPPQGPGLAEVMDAGLGLLRGVVALPHPEERLRLDDAERVGRLARRFAPARCFALPARSYLAFDRGRVHWAWGGVLRLAEDGQPTPAAEEHA